MLRTQLGTNSGGREEETSGRDIYNRKGFDPLTSCKVEHETKKKDKMCYTVF